MIEAPTNPSRATTALAVAFAMTFPTAMTWLYFFALGGTGQPNLLQQLAYATAKIIQFSFPLLFLAFLSSFAPPGDCRWPGLPAGNTRALWLGLGFGLLVGAAILAAYFGGLRSSPLLSQASSRIRAKMGEFGIGSGITFLSLSVFLAVAHSFLEEYYWRWFVFGRLCILMPVGWSVVLSSLAFTAHHVLIVWSYLPDQILTGVLPASLAVAVGGVVWAWLYHRGGSLLAPWLSHALVDAALFIVGWDLLQRT